MTWNISLIRIVALPACILHVPNLPKAVRVEEVEGQEVVRKRMKEHRLLVLGIADTKEDISTIKAAAKHFKDGVKFMSCAADNVLANYNIDRDELPVAVLLRDFNATGWPLGEGRIALRCCGGGSKSLGSKQWTEGALRDFIYQEGVMPVQTYPGTTPEEKAAVNLALESGRLVLFLIYGERFNTPLLTKILGTSDPKRSARYTRQLTTFGVNWDNIDSEIRNRIRKVTGVSSIKPPTAILLREQASKVLNADNFELEHVLNAVDEALDKEIEMISSRAKVAAKSKEHRVLIIGFARAKEHISTFKDAARNFERPIGFLYSHAEEVLDMFQLKASDMPAMILMRHFDKFGEDLGTKRMLVKLHTSSASSTGTWTQSALRNSILKEAIMPVQEFPGNDADGRATIDFALASNKRRLFLLVDLEEDKQALGGLLNESNNARYLHHLVAFVVDWGTSSTETKLRVQELTGVTDLSCPMAILRHGDMTNTIRPSKLTLERVRNLIDSALPGQLAQAQEPADPMMGLMKGLMGMAGMGTGGGDIKSTAMATMKKLMEGLGHEAQSSAGHSPPMPDFGSSSEKLKNIEHITSGMDRPKHAHASNGGPKASLGDLNAMMDNLNRFKHVNGKMGGTKSSPEDIEESMHRLSKMMQTDGNERVNDKLDPHLSKGKKSAAASGPMDDIMQKLSALKQVKTTSKQSKDKSDIHHNLADKSALVPEQLELFGDIMKMVNSGDFDHLSEDEKTDLESQLAKHGMPNLAQLRQELAHVKGMKNKLPKFEEL